MKLKRYVLPGVIVVCVLVLLAAAAWYSSEPDWQPMPESLTKLPDVDRSRMPLGPYTVDFSGLIGGSIDGRRATFYIVMRPGDVHLQREGEVGTRLANASGGVIGLGISYSGAYRPPSFSPPNGPMVGGLTLVASSLETYPIFETPATPDTSGYPIRITCYLGAEERDLIADTLSFKGVENGMCTATLWFATDLFATLDGIQPIMFASMAQFLPELYRVVSDRIQGEL